LCEEKPRTVGSLFAGIGGFDLGLEHAGYKVEWQVENDRFAATILERHWPAVTRFGDIREAVRCELPAVDVVCGGDPCPIRSRARRGRASIHPDLAGYFLAVVGRVRPGWVVRENVSAPDVRDFVVGLERLGYGTVVVELNSRDFTAQNRRRQYVVGGPRSRFDVFRERLAAFSVADDGRGTRPQGEEAQTMAHCLTAHPRRLAEDNYVLDPGLGVRSLAAEERELLQGFPAGWTKELSWSRRCILIGRAVTVPVATWLGQRMNESGRNY